MSRLYCCFHSRCLNNVRRRTRGDRSPRQTIDHGPVAVIARQHDVDACASWMVAPTLGATVPALRPGLAPPPLDGAYGRHPEQASLTAPAVMTACSMWSRTCGLAAIDHVQGQIEATSRTLPVQRPLLYFTAVALSPVPCTKGLNSSCAQ